MDYEVKNYKSKLTLLETEEAIKFVKDDFEKRLAKKLDLHRVSAPLFVYSHSGLNDDLNGHERKVAFDAKYIDDNIEIVQSLAKRKRHALSRYDFPVHKGLYTDMNAIRRDEELDNIHSIYVDQWDWEKIITHEERTKKYLFQIVRKIYSVFLDEEKQINKKYPCFAGKLPKNITFISTKELEKMYPNLTRKEREKEFAKKVKAYFLYQIGWPLKDGEPHDGRASDYDDWKLNGDIIFYNAVIDNAFEISSMGIRVDEESVVKQIKFKKEEEKFNSPFVRELLNKELPYTIGGGIGQSRLCMFFLEKAHIGEVQASLWDKKYLEKLKDQNIYLL